MTHLFKGPDRSTGISSTTTSLSTRGQETRYPDSSSERSRLGTGGHFTRVTIDGQNGVSRKPFMVTFLSKISRNVFVWRYRPKEYGP